jgi:hypothetical protein
MAFEYRERLAGADLEHFVVCRSTKHLSALGATGKGEKHSAMTSRKGSAG